MLPTITVESTPSSSVTPSQSLEVLRTFAGQWKVRELTHVSQGPDAEAEGEVCS